MKSSLSPFEKKLSVYSARSEQKGSFWQQKGVFGKKVPNLSIETDSLGANGFKCSSTKNLRVLGNSQSKAKEQMAETMRSSFKPQSRHKSSQRPITQGNKMKIDISNGFRIKTLSGEPSEKDKKNQEIQILRTSPEKGSESSGFLASKNNLSDLYNYAQTISVSSPTQPKAAVFKKGKKELKVFSGKGDFIGQFSSVFSSKNSRQNLETKKRKSLGQEAFDKQFLDEEIKRKSIKDFEKLEIINHNEEIKQYAHHLLSTILSVSSNENQEGQSPMIPVANMFMNLFKKINGFFSFFLKQNEDLKKAKKDLLEALETADFRRAQAEAKLALFPGNQKAGSPRGNEEEWKKKEQNWLVEKSGLEKSLEELKGKIKKKKNEEKTRNLAAENETLKTMASDMYKRFESKIKQRDGLIAKLEVEKAAFQNMAVNAENQFKETQKTHQALASKCEMILKENEQLSQEVQELRENTELQIEEIALLIQKRGQMELEMKESKQVLRSLQMKVAELSQEQNSVNQLLNEDQFERDLEICKTIKDEFIKSALVFNKKTKKQAEQIASPKTENEQKTSFSTKTIEKKEVASIGRSQNRKFTLDPSSPSLKNEEKSGENPKKIQDHLIFEKVSLAKLPEDNRIGALQHLKPSFFALIEEPHAAFKKRKPEEIEEIVKKRASWFFGMLRGILDSKFNEEQMKNGKGEISKFADFAFSFLGSSTVDLATKKIKPINQSENDSIDDARVLFFVCLYSQRYNRLWEVLVFRELLEEKNSNEHVSFLLRVRQMIFKGNQLRNHSPQEFINFVRWSNIEENLEKILRKFEEPVAKCLTEKIRKKIKEKNGRRLIDPYFILKVLSEVFLLEENKKYIQLRQIFNQFPSVAKHMTKISISFENFRKILEANFPSCSELEKAQLYREAYCCGESYVNVDSFFTVANEMNFFSQYVQINACGPCVLNSDGQIIETDFYSRLAAKTYKELQDPVFDRYERYSSELGVEDFYHEVQRVSIIARNKFQVDPAEFTSQSFFSASLFMVWKNLKAMILTLLQEAESVRTEINEKAFEEKLLQFFKGLKVIGGHCEQLGFASLAENHLFEKKLRFLQKFIKKKFNS